jgi:hypothetical protein
MSHVDGDRSTDPRTHLEAGLKDLTRLDKVRFINIVGSIQYGILYSIVFFFVGIGIHLLFPPFVKGEALLPLCFWILLQSIVIIEAVFYSRKFVEAIPGILSFFPGYFHFQELQSKGFVPYGVDEYRGDMASSIVLIGTQYRLLEKIAYVTSEVAKRMTTMAA